MDGWGQGLLDAGPCLNGVPRPREPKSGRWRLGGGDGNRSTSPFGIT